MGQGEWLLPLYNRNKEPSNSPYLSMKKWDLRGPPASRSERFLFVWNVLLLPELSDQPIQSPIEGTSVLGRPRDH